MHRFQGRAATIGVAAMAGAALQLSGCTADPSSDTGNVASASSSERGTTTVTATAPATTTEPGSTSTPAGTGTGLTSVDPATFTAPQHPDAYTWNYSTGGQYRGLCVSGGDGVTCTGKPAASVPDLTEHFPGRPSAIELGRAGLRFTFVEGIPGGPGVLETGQQVQIGETRCSKPNSSTLECRYGSNSFTITGAGQTISTSGNVLAERDYSNHPRSGGGSSADSQSGSGSSSGQPSDYMGASGLVSGVRTSDGRLVTASTPSCDGRGILILDSYVEASSPQQGIADLLDKHSGAGFATPGQCPSLRASLNGARVYPIYLDYGHDMAALCQAKASRGGNARLLTQTADFSDPC